MPFEMLSTEMQFGWIPKNKICTLRDSMQNKPATNTFSIQQDQSITLITLRGGDRDVAIRDSIEAHSSQASFGSQHLMYSLQLRR